MDRTWRTGKLVRAGRGPRTALAYALVLLAVLGSEGCTRRFFRKQADKDIHGERVGIRRPDTACDLELADVVHQHRPEYASRRPCGQQASVNRTHLSGSEEIRQVGWNRREPASVHRQDHAEDRHEERKARRTRRWRGGVEHHAESKEHRVGGLPPNPIRQRRPENPAADVEQAQEAGKSGRRGSGRDHDRRRTGRRARQPPVRPLQRVASQQSQG